MKYKIVQTDNFGGDYPNECFLSGVPLLSEDHAKKLADIINSFFSHDHPRWWKVVPQDYKLKPGFEP